MILYHGTSSEFDTFKLKKDSAVRCVDFQIQKVTPCGFFFTDCLETAWLFAFSREDRGPMPLTFPYVHEVEVETSNLLDLTINVFNMGDILSVYPNWCDGLGINPLRSEEFSTIIGWDIEDWWDVQMALDDADAVQSLEYVGYNGVILREENDAVSYCIFNVNAMKPIKKILHRIPQTSICFD